MPDDLESAMTGLEGLPDAPTKFPDHYDPTRLATLYPEDAARHTKVREKFELDNAAAMLESLPDGFGATTPATAQPPIPEDLRAATAKQLEIMQQVYPGKGATPESIALRMARDYFQKAAQNKDSLLSRGPNQEAADRDPDVIAGQYLYDLLDQFDLTQKYDPEKKGMTYVLRDLGSMIPSQDAIKAIQAARKNGTDPMSELARASPDIEKKMEAGEVYLLGLKRVFPTKEEINNSIASSYSPLVAWQSRSPVHAAAVKPDIEPLSFMEFWVTGGSRFIPPKIVPAPDAPAKFVMQPGKFAEVPAGQFGLILAHGLLESLHTLFIKAPRIVGIDVYQGLPFLSREADEKLLKSISMPEEVPTTFGQATGKAIGGFAPTMVALGGLGKVGQAALFSGLNLGPMWEQLSQPIRTVDGKPEYLPYGVRLAATVGSSLAIGGLTMLTTHAAPSAMETLAGRALAKPSVVASIRAGLNETQRSLLMSTRFSDALLVRGGQITSAAVFGATLNGAMSAVNQLALETGVTWRDGVHIEPSKIANAFAAGFSDFKYFLPMALMPGLQLPGDWVRKRINAEIEGKIAQSALDAGRLNMIAEQNKRTAMRVSDPDGYRELLGTILKGTDAEHVYIDLEGIEKAAAKAGLTPEDFAALAVGDGGQAYRDARSFGEPHIKVPMERVLMDVADHIDIFLDHSKLDTNGVSPAQAKRLSADYLAAKQAVVDAQYKAFSGMPDDLVALAKAWNEFDALIGNKQTAKQRALDERFPETTGLGLGEKAREELHGHFNKLTGARMLHDTQAKIVEKLGDLATPEQHEELARLKKAYDEAYEKYEQRSSGLMADSAAEIEPQPPPDPTPPLKRSVSADTAFGFRNAEGEFVPSEFSARIRHEATAALDTIGGKVEAVFPGKPEIRLPLRVTESGLELPDGTLVDIPMLVSEIAPLRIDITYGSTKPPPPATAKVSQKFIDLLNQHLVAGHAPDGLAAALATEAATGASSPAARILVEARAKKRSVKETAEKILEAIRLRPLPTEKEYREQAKRDVEGDAHDPSRPGIPQGDLDNTARMARDRRDSAVANMNTLHERAFRRAGAAEELGQEAASRGLEGADLGLEAAAKRTEEGKAAVAEEKLKGKRIEPTEPFNEEAQIKQAQALKANDEQAMKLARVTAEAARKLADDAAKALKDAQAEAAAKPKKKMKRELARLDKEAKESAKAAQEAQEKLKVVEEASKVINEIADRVAEDAKLGGQKLEAEAQVRQAAAAVEAAKAEVEKAEAAEAQAATEWGRELEVGKADLERTAAAVSAAQEGLKAVTVDRTEDLARLNALRDEIFEERAKLPSYAAPSQYRVDPIVAKQDLVEALNAVEKLKKEDAEHAKRVKKVSEAQPDRAKLEREKKKLIERFNERIEEEGSEALTEEDKRIEALDRNKQRAAAGPKEIHPKLKAKLDELEAKFEEGIKNFGEQTAKELEKLRIQGEDLSLRMGKAQDAVRKAQIRVEASERTANQHRKVTPAEIEAEAHVKELTRRALEAEKALAPTLEEKVAQEVLTAAEKLAAEAHERAMKIADRPLPDSSKTETARKALKVAEDALVKAHDDSRHIIGKIEDSQAKRHAEKVAAGTEARTAAAKAKGKIVQAEKRQMKGTEKMGEALPLAEEAQQARHQFRMARALQEAAQRAKKEIDALERRIGVITSAGAYERMYKGGKGAQPFYEIHALIAEALGVRASKYKLPSYYDLYKQIGAEKGIIPDFDAEFIDGLLQKPRPIGAMSVAEVRKVHEALSWLHEQATGEAQVKLGADNIFLSEAYTMLTQDTQNIPLFSGALGEKFFAELRSPTETTLPRFGRLGLAIRQMFYEARNRYLDQLREQDKKLESAFHTMPRDVQKTLMNVVEGPRITGQPYAPWTVAKYMYAAGWMMSESGKRKLLNGLLGPMQIDETKGLNARKEAIERRQVELEHLEHEIRTKMHDHLTEAHIEFVQNIVDTFQPLFALEKEKEVTLGRAQPKEVEPLEFKWKTGRVFKGGYFPVSWAKSSIKSMTDAQIAHAQWFGDNVNQRMFTIHHFLDARKEGFYGVPNLEWGTIPSLIRAIAHDVAFDPFQVSATKIFTNDDIKKEIILKYGEHTHSQMIEWLRDTARGHTRFDSEAAHNIRDMVRTAGIKFGSWVFSLNLPVLLGDVANPVAFAIRHGYSPNEMLLATGETLTPGAWAEAFSMSKELPYRNQGFIQNYRENWAALGVTTKPNSVKRAVMEGSFILRHKMDIVQATMFWRAAYNRNVRTQGKAEAARIADDLVRSSLPVVDWMQQSGFVRDRGMIAALLLVRAYPNILFNMASTRNWHRKTQIWDGASPMMENSKMALHMFSMLVVTNLLSEYMMGRGTKRDESEEMWQWAVKNGIAGLMYPIPFMGEFATAAGAYAAGIGKPPQVLKAIPPLGLADAYFRHIGSLGYDLTYGDKYDFKDKMDLARIVGRAMMPVAWHLGVPMPLTRSAEGLADVSLGDPTNDVDNFFDLMDNVMYGVRKTHTPLSGASDLWKMFKSSRAGSKALTPLTGSNQ